MRKTVLMILALVMASSTGCRLFKEKHVYQDVKEQPPLKVPDGLDQPSPVAALSVPPAKAPGKLMTDIQPPGMAFQLRHSESGKVLIENQHDKPVLTFFGPAHVVHAAIQNMDLPTGWTLAGRSGDCDATLTFVDSKAGEVKKMGFFKRIFSRQGRVIDRSGQYRLICQPSAGKTTLTFLDSAGQAPDALLVDAVLGSVYQQLLQTEKTEGSNTQP